MRNADSARDARPLSADSLPRIVVFLALLLFGASLECWRLSSLRDPDIWGHLRLGAWILENKTWPQSGLFSQAQSLLWKDYSWAFDLLSGFAFRLLGLHTLPALLVVSRLALAILLFALSGGWQNFWPAAGLSLLGQYVLFGMGPGPMFVSVLLFGVEFLVLMRARNSGNTKELVALPVLFLVWTNSDLGFVYGIALYLIFLIALIAENRQWTGVGHGADSPGEPISLSTACMTGVACAIVTLVNPYGYHPYVSFFANEFSKVNANLPGYGSMGFRQPRDYALMLLGMGAYLALGLVRSRDLFRIGSLAGSTALAFHAQREGWLLALVSVAVIGGTALHMWANSGAAFVLQWNQFRMALFGAGTIVLAAVIFARVPWQQSVLLSKAGETFPVGAANFLRQHPQPTPFFNDYKWGAFLTWYLPEYPVAIDARRGLYLEETELAYFQAMNADIPYRQFPPMNQARTLLMDKSSIMGQAFRGVAGFRVVYEDGIAIVYSHESTVQP